MNASTLKIGLSPCPNDTFIFHALLHGLVAPASGDAPEFEPVFADVEQLNSLALKAQLPITKVSAGVLPAILKDYVVLNSGAALGFGCGPLLVAKDPRIDPATARIAMPGKYTTANLLLDLHGEFTGPRKEMLFSDIMPAIQAGEVDAGVIIHEGRFVYPDYGLTKILDFGEWWESAHAVPLPLGVIVVRRDLAPDLARNIEAAIAESIRFAMAQPELSKPFIHNHAQELDNTVTSAHIRTFVTDYSLDLGSAGRSAIRKLLAIKPDVALACEIFLSA